jgi:FKBP-type peptidyl-prolyl cis-trans isomerase
MSVTAVPLPAVERRVVGGLWFGLALLALVGIVAAWYTTSKVELPPQAFLARNAKQPGVVTLPSGVQYQVLRPGSGARPTTSDIALINYEGRFANGIVFDRGGPAPMPVGRTFPGFAEGLMQMPVGSKYRLWIPPALGLPEGGGPIPPNSLLIFDVELLMVMPQQAAAPPAGLPQ